MDIKILILLSFGHLVTDISQGALPALLPFLKQALGLSYTAAGMVLLISNLTSSLIQPLFGLISDRQPKPLLIPLGILCAALGISLSGLASSYALLLLLVVFCGLGVAAFHPEGFKTAHFFIGKRKASGMSLFAVGGNLGFALGPFTLVFLVTHFSLKGTLFYLLPGLLMVAATLFFLSTFRYTDAHRGNPDQTVGPKRGFLLRDLNPPHPGGHHAFLDPDGSGQLHSLLLHQLSEG